MQQTDRAALYELDDIKKNCRSYQDIPRAYRDRAMKILEVDGRGFPRCGIRRRVSRTSPGR